MSGEGIESDMVEKSLSYGINKKEWGSRFSSHSGTLVFSGLILIGFIIAWLFGGFPSILLPSFIILAIGLLGDLFSTISKSTPKKKPEPVNLLEAIFIIVMIYFAFAFLCPFFLRGFQGPYLNKILSKVEYPFSEADQVIADSEGSIYVFSVFNCRVQKYSRDGRFQFGWFSGEWRAIEVAIDENDFIYTYPYDGSIIRQYDRNGNMIQKVSRSEQDEGWWRLKENFVVWERSAKKAGHYDKYSEVAKDGDLLPLRRLRETGFKAADARYYKLTRLWSLFPVVSVERNLSEFEGYIMPNPLSFVFTFVFPGFLLGFVFFMIGVIMYGVHWSAPKKPVKSQIEESGQDSGKDQSMAFGGQNDHILRSYVVGFFTIGFAIFWIVLVIWATRGYVTSAGYNAKRARSAGDIELATQLFEEAVREDTRSWSSSALYALMEMDDLSALEKVIRLIDLPDLNYIAGQSRERMCEAIRWRTASTTADSLPLSPYASQDVRAHEKHQWQSWLVKVKEQYNWRNGRFVPKEQE